jgi:hypothetical protein
MHLPKMFGHFVTATVSPAMTLGTSNDWAEMLSRVVAMLGVLVAETVSITFEGLSTSEMSTSDTRG